MPAFRFAILAVDDKACRSAAAALLARGDRTNIELAVNWLLANANSLRLSAVAYHAIESLADAFTKPQIDAVFQWLLPRCERDAKSRVQEDACRRAWKAMGHVAIQLDAASADRLCQAATKHRFSTSFDTERKALMNAVGNCLNTSTHTTKKTVATDLARAVTANDSKTHEDRISTINLFAYACRLCDDQTKKQVEKEVYPKGAKLSPEMILVAPRIVARDLSTDRID